MKQRLERHRAIDLPPHSQIPTPSRQLIMVLDGTVALCLQLQPLPPPSIVSATSHSQPSSNMNPACFNLHRIQKLARNDFNNTNIEKALKVIDEITKVPASVSCANCSKHDHIATRGDAEVPFCDASSSSELSDAPGAGTSPTVAKNARRRIGRNTRRSVRQSWSPVYGGRRSVQRYETVQQVV
ncbi:hypothetical protein BV25DRAFT_708543 [Artomyces pyxidatus]|uniref:Uncharacterized protein n=1 Tax=Artomyces pyxidatus TaxID=48021 RepID=A0ACB8SZC7_9AGAM|nr:hypothetical protein BV25DRAFT_708543 [Artomyces pyxidatus]